MSKIYQKTKKVLSKEDHVDIAVEVHIARNFSERKYKFNWSDDEKLKSEGCKSKKSFGNWLKTTYTDIDFVDLYIDNFILKQTDHVDKQGNWKARKFIEAVKYICRKLIDPRYISSKKVRRDFEASSRNRTWRENAFGVALNYLTRKLQEKDRLKSNYLYESISCMKEMNETISEVYALPQKSNNDIDVEAFKEDLISSLTSSIMEKSTNIKNNNKQELKIYENVKQAIIKIENEELPFVFNDQMRLVKSK